MRISGRKLTDAEITDAFWSVVKIIIENYKQPVPESFRRESRAAWIGYRIQRLLLDKKIIETGDENEQRRMEI